MPFFLSDDYDNIPAMNWRKLWGRTLLRFGRALNAISHFSLKKASIVRTMLTGNIVVHTNGFRDDGVKVYYLQNYQGAGGDNVNVWNIQIANIRVIERETGHEPVDQMNPLVAKVLVNYKLEFVLGDDVDVWEMWACFPSVDGIKYPMGDSMNNLRYSYSGTEEGQNSTRFFTLSGAIVADMIAGEHMINLEVVFPRDSVFRVCEVNITRVNW